MLRQRIEELENFKKQVYHSPRKAQRNVPANTIRRAKKIIKLDRQWTSEPSCDKRKELIYHIACQSRFVAKALLKLVVEPKPKVQRAKR